MPLQIRRGTNAERQSMTIPLAPGEPLYTTDQGFLYVGDGTTLGGVQVTGYGDENAVDAVGAALVSGQNQNIQFIYDQIQDANNRIDAILDLSIYNGDISADSFKGNLLAEDDTIIFNSQTKELFVSNILTDDSTILFNSQTNELVASGITVDTVTLLSGILNSDLKGSVFGDDSSILIDAINLKINLDGTVKGNIIPDINEFYDIGSFTNRFKDLYLSGSSLWLGDAQLRSIGTTINLPAGSTVDGIPLGSGDGIVEGSNYRINIIGDNSTLLVDSSNGSFFGSLTGDVTADTISTNSLSVNTLTSTVTSSFSLNFYQQDGTGSSILIEKNSDDNVDPATLSFQKSRGSLQAPVAVGVLDRVGSVNFRAFDGFDYQITSQIRSDVIGPVSAGVVPSGITFNTTDFVGNYREAARIDLSRGLSITRESFVASLAGFQSIHDSNTQTGAVGLVRSRGTNAAPTAIIENDPIVDLTFSGRSGPPPSFPTTCAYIRAVADGPVSLNVIPGRFEFYTADLAGTLTRRMVIKNNGVLQVDAIESLNGSLSIRGDLSGSVFADNSTMIIDGTEGGKITSPSVTLTDFLKLPAFADDAARSSAIPIPEIGMVIFMQNGASPATTNRPQFYDGTAWQNL